MLKIDPATAFLLYLGFTISILMIVWVRHNISRKRREIIPPEFSLITCEYCSHGYIKKKEKPLSRCPKCESLNK